MKEPKSIMSNFEDKLQVLIVARAGVSWNSSS